MHTISKTLLTILSLCLPLTVLADFTHLNVDHREIVQLRMGSYLDPLVASSCPASFNERALQEVLTTGNLANREFTVPAGKEFIITDVEYTLSNGPSQWNGELIQVRLKPQKDGNLSSVFSTTIAASLPPITSPASGLSLITDRVNFTAGVRVASRRSICAVAENIRTDTVSVRSSRFLRLLNIQGYLVDKSI